MLDIGTLHRRAGFVSGVGILSRLVNSGGSDGVRGHYPLPTGKRRSRLLTFFSRVFHLCEGQEVRFAISRAPTYFDMALTKYSENAISISVIWRGVGTPRDASWIWRCGT
jgi:hypothetical protein